MEPPRRGNDPLFGRLMNRMSSRPIEADRVQEGSVVRASPADRSPFLLEGQEFHKSIVLVLSDETRFDEQRTQTRWVHTFVDSGLDSG